MYHPQTMQPVVVSAPTPAPHVVVPTTPAQRTMKVAAIRGLSIAQIIIGVIVTGCGIGVASGLYSNWINGAGYAIWGGIWITITGIIGVISASKPNSRGLVGTYMAFSIISTVVAFSDTIPFGVALGLYSNCKPYYYYIYNYNYYNNYYNNYNYYNYYNYYSYNSYYKVSFYDSFRCDRHNDAGIALYGILVTCMIIEFFVALIASIYCCLACCSCCDAPTQTRGVVFQTQPQYLTTTYANQGYPVNQGYAAPTAGIMQPVNYNDPQQQYPLQQQQQQHFILQQQQHLPQHHYPSPQNNQAVDIPNKEVPYSPPAYRNQVEPPSATNEF